MWMSVDDGRSLRRATPSGGLQGEYPLDVPAHRHQVPLATHVRQPSQQELPEPHRRFDAAEYRFRRLFAQRVELAAGRGLQPMGHALERSRGRRRRLGCRREAPAPTRVMGLATQRDQRLDLGRGAAFDIVLAEVAVVGEQSPDATQALRQAVSRPSIGASCCLSLAACVSPLATISRLSAATAAWAL